jgi:5'-3' exonuclease
MGIKYFFGWFYRNFGMECNTKIYQHTEIKAKIDNLMIDMNGIIHNSTQKIYEYGNFKKQPSFINPNISNKKSVDELNMMVFHDICLTIENLLFRLRPTKRLVMCIDGTAPISKQNQQRQRRYRASIEMNANQNTTQNIPTSLSPLPPSQSFDSCSITPGTKFLDSLSTYVELFIKRRILDRNSIWSNIETVFSNEKCVGEGEQKLVAYIRQYGSNTESYCFVGNDADLFMLTLATQKEHIYIFREDAYSTNFVDVGKFRKMLCNFMRHTTTPGYEFNNVQLINDFILLGFMTGNDFLPHIPTIEIIQGGIETIVEIYKKVSVMFGYLTYISDGKVLINIHTLGIFFRSLGLDEEKLINAKLLRGNDYFPDEEMNKHVKIVNDVPRIDMKQYKLEYTSSLVSEQLTIENICHLYYEGLQWVLSYYTTGVSNWTWCYNIYYAPFASTLANYASTYVQKTYGRTEPNLPFVQLLSVIPPKSSELLPLEISHIVKSDVFKKYCPDDIKIDISGKKNAWEGIAIVPFIDQEIVKQEYEKYSNGISSEDMRRNIRNSTHVYRLINNHILSTDIEIHT